MPELPEVETIRRQLDEGSRGRTVTSLSAFWEKTLHYVKVDHHEVEGQQLVEAKRRGKVLLLHLTGGVTVLVHLRMTGQLLVDEHCELIGPMTRAVLTLDQGQLVFNDQRKFGRIVVMRSDEIETDSLLGRMGPEPLSSTFTAAVLAERLGRHRTASVKAALLDQSTVAGLGNIYVDEVLFAAKIHPNRPSQSLKAGEISRLAQTIPAVLRSAIAVGGSTMRDYRDAKGASGKYLDQASVFGRTGEACRICETPIVKLRIAGRGTHVCPNCQHVTRKRR